jgi:hypothetical protein
MRTAPFDLSFIAGTTLIAVGSGWLVLVEESLWGLILGLDLWLLGYHHVIATFTRLCFDRESVRENRFLLFKLPPLILGAVVASYFLIGSWTIPSIYLYWQWWHYTRQSYGVGQIYKRKSPGGFTQSDLLTKAAIYLVPLWGIVHRSNQRPESFLGSELGVLTVPSVVETLIAVAAIGSVAWWIRERLIAWRRGEIAVGHALYMTTHWVIFLIGYVLIDNINTGWLVLNIWHNAQYVLFVWLFNTGRFRKGIDPKARFLSTISQPRNIVGYFIVVVGLSTTIYVFTQASMGGFESAALPLTLIVYQAVNFHHYIVDSKIWKVRRKPLQDTLQLNTVDDAA